MKRRIRFEIYVDYDKIMEEKKIPIVQKGYCSKAEEEHLSNLVNLLHRAIPFIKEIGYCIEDYEKRSVEGFEISNKMGSSCLNISKWN